MEYETRLLKQPSPGQLSVLGKRTGILTSNTETCWLMEQLYIVFSFID